MKELEVYFRIYYDIIFQLDGEPLSKLNVHSEKFNNFADAKMVYDSMVADPDKSNVTLVEEKVYRLILQ